MYIGHDPNGDFILDPGKLADRFGLSSDDFQRRIRQGLVTSTVERGEGEDTGTCRLSVRLGNRIWRAIMSDEGEVRRESVTFLRGNPIR